MKHPDHDLSAQDRIGLKLASRLSAGADTLPHDISERLRVARQQALSQHKLAQAPAMTAVGNGSAALAWGGDDDHRSLWHRVMAIIPLLALIAGLMAIYVMENDQRAEELADIDAALLTDDLPPTAYTDPGFLQFLKIHRTPAQ
jgi:hypothetical protein